LRRRVVAAFAAFALVGGAAQAVLFPEPLHVVREVHDSVSGETVTIHEYCERDTIVTASRGRIVIRDFGRQQLTEIDTGAATFSITSFADVARGSAVLTAARKKVAGLGEPRATRSRRADDGRALEIHEFGGKGITVTVGVDRGTRLSIEAAEALIGAAYPNTRSVVHEAMLRAAAGPRSRTEAASTTVALPVEYELVYEIAGDRVERRSRIVSIDRELAPPSLTAIPPGSQQIESRLTALPRLLQELDGGPQQRK
jgi:hypothetical protein